MQYVRVDRLVEAISLSIEEHRRRDPSLDVIRYRQEQEHARGGRSSQTVLIEPVSRADVLKAVLQRAGADVVVQSQDLATLYPSKNLPLPWAEVDFEVPAEHAWLPEQTALRVQSDMLGSVPALVPACAEPLPPPPHSADTPLPVWALNLQKWPPEKWMICAKWPAKYREKLTPPESASDLPPEEHAEFMGAKPRLAVAVAVVFRMARAGNRDMKLRDTIHDAAKEVGMTDELDLSKAQTPDYRRVKIYVDAVLKQAENPRRSVIPATVPSK